MLFDVRLGSGQPVKIIKKTNSFDFCQTATSISELLVTCFSYEPVRDH